MKFYDFLSEQEISNFVDNAERLKSQLISKISDLPETDETVNLIKEIEDLLTDSGFQQRFKNIGQSLDDLNDADISKGKRILSKYISSIPATSQQRAEFFELLKADKLVNQKIMTSPGKHTALDIIPSTSSNPFIKELVYDLSQVASYGVGKGEFLLAVLSRSITKATKGDLQFSKLNKKIEVKTFHSGGGRFTDRSVRPTSNYQTLVQNFLNTFGSELETWGYETSATGLNLQDLIAFGQTLKSENAKRFDIFTKQVSNIIHSIFNANDLRTKRRKHSLITNIIDGQSGFAADTYITTSLANYLGSKNVDGILMIDTSAFDAETNESDVYFVYVDGNREYSKEESKKLSYQLFKQDMSLVASTIYPLAFMHDADAFPQVKVSYFSKADPSAIARKQSQEAEFYKKTNTPDLTPSVQPAAQTPPAQSAPLPSAAAENPELDNIKKNAGLSNIPT